MSNEYDQTVVQRTLDGPSDPMTFPVTNMRLLSVPDLNQGSYSASQVRFSTSNVGSSNEVCDFTRSYLRIPVTFTATCAVNGGLNASLSSHYLMTLKNSVTSVLDSVVVSSGGVDLVSKNGGLLHQHCSYSLLTTFNEADVEAMGSSMYFRPDDYTSFDWDAAQGEMNTAMDTNATMTKGSRIINSARIRRHFDEVDSFIDGVRGQFLSAAYANTLHRGYSTTALVAAAANSLTTYYEINIPLRYLHGCNGLFANLPLMRAATINMLVNTHLPATCVIPYTAVADPAPGIFTTTTPNGFLPFNVATGTALNGGNRDTHVNIAGNVITYNMRIGNVNNTQCSLELCMLELQPEIEAKLIASPLKKVFYDDFYAFRDLITNLVPGGTCNQQISVNISKLRKIVVIPRVAVNGNGEANRNGDVRLSPFSTHGCTTSPAYYTNVQCYVSGKPVFQTNLQYSFEQFQSQQAGSSAVNGGFDRGLGGGNLITKAAWNTGVYSYLVVDLSRKHSSEDVLEKNLVLSWVNAGNVAMSYDVLVIYERSVTFDCFSGRVII